MHTTYTRLLYIHAYTIYTPVHSAPSRSSSLPYSDLCSSPPVSGPPPPVVIVVITIGMYYYDMCTSIICVLV